MGHVLTFYIYTFASQSTQYRVRKCDVTIFFLYFGILNTIFWWSIIKNIHSQKFGGNQFMGSEIWPHEYLISLTKVSVNWPGSKQL